MRNRLDELIRPDRSMRQRLFEYKLMLFVCIWCDKKKKKKKKKKNKVYLIYLGKYRDYYSGVLSLNRVTATHLKIGIP